MFGRQSSSPETPTSYPTAHDRMSSHYTKDRQDARGIVFYEGGRLHGDFRNILYGEITGPMRDGPQARQDRFLYFKTEYAGFLGMTHRSKHVSRHMKESLGDESVFDRQTRSRYKAMNAKIVRQESRTHAAHFVHKKGIPFPKVKWVRGKSLERRLSELKISMEPTHNRENETKPYKKSLIMVGYGLKKMIKNLDANCQHLTSSEGSLLNGIRDELRAFLGKDVSKSIKQPLSELRPKIESLLVRANAILTPDKLTEDGATFLSDIRDSMRDFYGECMEYGSFGMEKSSYHLGGESVVFP